VKQSLVKRLISTTVVQNLKIWLENVSGTSILCRTTSFLEKHDSCFIQPFSGRTRGKGTTKEKKKARKAMRI